MLEALPGLPHLAELPARGPGADMLGRGAALLVDLHVDLQPSGWRFVPRPGREARWGRDLLRRDLDALEEAAVDYSGPLKVQVPGPWTLAAGIELHRGNRTLSDRGATRDLLGSLVEGLRLHLLDLARRVPGAQWQVQIDEPTLPAALAGHLRTASGFDVLKVVQENDAEQALAAVTAAITGTGAVPLVHCCAPEVPLRLLTRAGFAGISLDAGLLTPRHHDRIGEAVEDGTALLLGLVPSLPPPGPVPKVATLAAPALTLWSRLGLAPELLAEAVVVTPTCGLAGADPGWARTALRLCREVAQHLGEHAGQPVEEDRRR